MPWQRKADAPYVVVTDAGLWALALIRFPFLQYLAPTLGGETIDVTTFCAAGPAYDPPVTMADVVWLGIPPAGRPWALLAVTREIARQELFAKYCENTDVSTMAWQVFDELDLVKNFDVWEIVLYRSTRRLPTGTTHQRTTLHSGIENKLRGYWTTTGPAVEQESYDSAANNATGRFGLGSPYVYVPPAVWQDPNVQLPSGTGATLDQLPWAPQRTGTRLSLALRERRQTLARHGPRRSKCSHRSTVTRERSPTVCRNLTRICSPAFASGPPSTRQAWPPGPDYADRHRGGSYRGTPGRNRLPHHADGSAQLGHQVDRRTAPLPRVGHDHVR